MGRLIYYTLILFFSKYFLSAPFGLVTVLGSENTAMKETSESLLLWSLHSRGIITIVIITICHYI